MATSPIYGWAEPDNTDLVKNGALAIRTLGNAIDTTMGTMTPKSTVTAKGSLIAATAASTPANLSAGNNGEALYADSTASTGLRYVATPSASNPVINSAFNVWQRGTSVANIGTVSYSADRWAGYFASGGMTTSRQATGDTTNLPNIQYCARVQRDVSSTNTNILYMGTNFETVNSIPFAGKTVNLSFYARKGANYNANNLLAFKVNTGTGTDQNVFTGFTGVQTPINGTVTLSNTWQRFTAQVTITSGTLTAALASTATQIAILFEYTPTGTAGAADYFEITGVQLDIGATALPYRAYAATFQGELAACQRYYFRAGANSGGTTSAFSTYGQGFTASTTEAYAQVYFPETMRVNPTDIGYGNLAFADSAGNFNNLVSIAFNQINTNSVNLYCYGFTGLTANRPGRLANNNNTAGYFYASSEL